MSLSRWTGPVLTGLFRFDDRPEPLEVVLTHTVIAPDLEAPPLPGRAWGHKIVGEPIVRRYLNGVLVAESRS